MIFPVFLLLFFAACGLGLLGIVLLIVDGITSLHADGGIPLGVVVHRSQHNLPQPTVPDPRPVVLSKATVRIPDATLCRFQSRNLVGFFAPRGFWDRMKETIPLKGDVSWRGDGARVVVRVMLGLPVFLAGWTLGWLFAPGETHALLRFGPPLLGLVYSMLVWKAAQEMAGEMACEVRKYLEERQRTSGAT